MPDIAEAVKERGLVKVVEELMDYVDAELRPRHEDYREVRNALAETRRVAELVERDVVDAFK